MSSNTQKTDNKRKVKNRKQGSARKKALESKGTTLSEQGLFGDVLER